LVPALVATFVAAAALLALLLPLQAVSAAIAAAVNVRPTFMSLPSKVVEQCAQRTGRHSVPNADADAAYSRNRAQLPIISLA
jgi:hypothetical protein